MAEKGRFTMPCGDGFRMLYRTNIKCTIYGNGLPRGMQLKKIIILETTVLNQLMPSNTCM